MSTGAERSFDLGGVFGLDWLRLSRPTFVEEFSSSLRVLTAIVFYLL